MNLHRSISLRFDPIGVDLTIPYGPKGFVRYPCPKCARGDHSSHGPTCCKEINGMVPFDGVCSCKEGIKTPGPKPKSSTR